MRLDSEQRRFVEYGYAMVYRGGHGTERYLEQALDAFGKPSPGNAEYYVFDAFGNTCGASPYRTLEEAQSYVDELLPDDSD